MQNFLFAPLSPRACSFQPLIGYSFRRSLKFQKAFLPVHHSVFRFSFSFRSHGSFFRVIWLRDFFSFGFSVVLSGPREGNQQKMFDLLDAVPSNAPSILGFSFRTPDLSSDYLLLARISILPVFPTLLHFATCLCAIGNANGSDPFCRNHRIVREIKFYLIKENF